MSKQRKQPTATPPVGDLPPDHEHRQRILRELDTTMLVEAAAGTGKTTSMIGRMVALLREGECRIDTMAAVTFTRKSTAELRARFQLELERRAAAETGPAGQRLAEALLHVERCFIGTIHSFCARLLRERPMEAGVDLAFSELEDAEDFALRDEAWNEYVSRLYADGSPILAELADLGIEIGQLQAAFVQFAGYPDVDQWPAPEIELPDLAPVLKRIEAYAADMEELAPTFPPTRGNDKLMSAYELIPRLVRQMNRAKPSEVMDLLAQFKKTNAVQKEWPGGAAQGKREQTRWDDFFVETAEPLCAMWLERRYAAVIRALQPAVEIYDRLRKEADGLNFQDLLMKAAALLRDKPAIRRYFRARFTHLLVDEFQDTDPIQAEVMLLLTADKADERDWRRCRPAPGSLFVVGDPKQSIFRFRRADIVIYTQVKEIMLAAGGAVVPLTANFRTTGDLVAWGNQVFDQVFPATANAWSPAACPMQIGRTAETAAQFKGLHVLRVPDTHGNKDLSLEFESDFVARTIRQALDNGVVLPRTQKELDRGVPATAQPGDFLIVTRMKKQLALYARKLGELGIPHQVTGGSALGQVSELALLSKCLVAVAEPENPVALVAVLRGELFGVSDTALYAFRKAGGRFDYRTAVPVSLIAEAAAAMGDAFARLERYRTWLQRLPPISAFERIASDLGLPMRAAAAVGGNVHAGCLAKAFEMLRAAQAELNSMADLAELLGQLIDENRAFDGLPARPHDAPVVRLMNLHKVKGLESPVVFLSDPTGEFDFGIKIHIDRSGEPVRGYMGVYGRKTGKQSPPVLAQPSGWDALSAAEKRFEDAEDQRLMYVAATRAGAALVIVQRAKRNDQNPWEFFEPFLQGSPELPDPGPQAGPAGKEIVVTAADVASAIGNVANRWDQSAMPSYATAAAKELSLAPSRVHFHATTGEHGTEWGTVIHLLLETAVIRPDADLHQLARLALVEEGLDASEADHAVEMVKKVIRSNILRRARSASQHLVEVPFQKLVPAGAARAASGLPTVVRGVIDLAFREATGWVIVDYKTDRIATGQLPAAIDRYRAQVGTYADAWGEMLGHPVHECGLYFTHVDSYVRL
jgi:ATP-dependent helicase/nuclease subunit A